MVVENLFSHHFIFILTHMYICVVKDQFSNTALTINFWDWCAHGEILYLNVLFHTQILHFCNILFVFSNQVLKGGGGRRKFPFSSFLSTPAF